MRQLFQKRVTLAEALAHWVEPCIGRPLLAVEYCPLAVKSAVLPSPHCDWCLEGVLLQFAGVHKHLFLTWSQVDMFGWSIGARALEPGKIGSLYRVVDAVSAKPLWAPLIGTRLIGADIRGHVPEDPFFATPYGVELRFEAPDNATRLIATALDGIRRIDDIDEVAVFDAEAARHVEIGELILSLPREQKTGVRGFMHEVRDWYARLAKRR